MNLTLKTYKFFQILPRNSSSLPHKLPVVKVLSSNSDDTVRLSFKYSHSSNLVVKAPKNETVLNVLSRIKLVANLQRKREEIRRTVMNKHSGNAHIALQDSVENIDVFLIKNDSCVDGNIINEEAWSLASHLKIGNILYDIKYNQPTVISLTLPEYILAGCSLRPRFRLESATVEECSFTWYRSQPKHNGLDLPNIENPDKMCSEDDKNWTKVGEGFIYTTTTNDIDCYLKLVCIPKRGNCSGNVHTVESSTTVKAISKKFPFENRHEYTKTLTNDNSIRCVSYNILANSYVEKKKFPYSSEKARNNYYRKQLLFKELMGYNSDIICLQEVEERVFNYDCVPLLKQVGYEGWYKKKGGRRYEGLATFFRSNKFKLIKNYGVLLNEIIYEDTYKDLRTKVSGSNKDISVLLKQDSALQITLLQQVKYPNRKLLVANTHLYSNKDNPEVRLIQAAVCTNCIENLIKTMKLDSFAILFCGDFNSLPSSDTFSFITSGKCSPNWKNGNNSSNDSTLIHNLQFRSACGTPDYTNYTEEFKGCLDYIFYSENSLKVDEIVPMPKHEDVFAQTGLPSEYFPSDHIALVCTLKWTNS